MKSSVRVHTQNKLYEHISTKRVNINTKPRLYLKKIITNFWVVTCTIYIATHIAFILHFRLVHLHQKVIDLCWRSVVAYHGRLQHCLNHGQSRALTVKPGHVLDEVQLLDQGEHHPVSGCRHFRYSLVDPTVLPLPRKSCIRGVCNLSPKLCHTDSRRGRVWLCQIDCQIERFMHGCIA